ncbi:hypothetical protein OHV05_34580 [Kitasatospora sp. NBC_00070]|uniref:hypothetical protein n=1 Tax=Kitasatospora sp. NBC_00070 TaxID=2975962 RepID=UPI00324E33EA
MVGVGGWAIGEQAAQVALRAGAGGDGLGPLPGLAGRPLALRRVFGVGGGRRSGVGGSGR